MTEEEAKTKWCPYARLDGNNRHWGSAGDAAPISRCVASSCMAWRWSEPDTATRWVSWGEMRETASGKSNGEYRYITPAERNGYCGLAGATQ